MRVPVEDMTFIIRSAGERTLGASAGVLRTLVDRAGGRPDEQVTIVAERPFAAAVKRTFEIGLEGKRPWVVGMDADVLLLSDAVERIGSLCAAADGAVYSIASLVLCRFFGGFCFRGIHMYPRRHLAQALAVADSVRDELRPESAIARVLEPRGLKGWGPPVPIGVHDYEQYLKHVYLKMRLRGRREMVDGGQAAVDTAAASVGAREHDGPDMLAAQWGLTDGAMDARSANAPAHYDWSAEYPEFSARLARHGLTERSPMCETGLGIAERVIAAHDFSADQRTPDWIRSRLGFDRGADHALRRIGVDPSFLNQSQRKQARFAA